MSTVAMSGNDTVLVNNKPIFDGADGDVAVLTFPNDIANVKTGKNGNSIYGLNESGKQAELKIRVIRGSADDKYLNGLLAGQQLNFAGMVLLTAFLVKKVGDGKGNITSDTYVLSGGIFSKQVEAKSNVEGDSAQSVAEYTLKFSNAPRAIT
jgi:hypothetical protein